MLRTPRSERRTQNRVVALFADLELADHLRYRYVGERCRREPNHLVETLLVRKNLTASGCSAAYVAAVVRKALSRRAQLK